MNTLETTVSMLEMLPEEDLVAINGIVKRFVCRLQDSPYMPLSKEETLAELEVARQHASEGRVKDGILVAEQMEEKYGL